MRLAVWEMDCPVCRGARVRVVDRPSVASINKMLPPTARKPVPADDAWGYSPRAGCSACGLSAEEVARRVEASGKPDDAVEMSR